MELSKVRRCYLAVSDVRTSMIDLFTSLKALSQETFHLIPNIRQKSLKIYLASVFRKACFGPNQFLASFFFFAHVMFYKV